MTHIESDDAVLEMLGKRLSQLRLNRNMTQEALAKEAGVSKLTVHRLEHGHSIQLTNFIRILRKLDILENVNALIPEPVESPLQQLKRSGKTRRRSSPTQAAPSTTNSDREVSEFFEKFKPDPTWSWDDDA